MNHHVQIKLSWKTRASLSKNWKWWEGNSRCFGDLEIRSVYKLWCNGALLFGIFHVSETRGRCIPWNKSKNKSLNILSWTFHWQYWILLDSKRRELGTRFKMAKSYYTDRWEEIQQVCKHLYFGNWKFTAVTHIWQ